MLNEFLKKIETELKSQEVFYLRIKVIPSSPKNDFVELLEDEEVTLKMRIAAPPEKGKANKEICKFLGKYFNCDCEIILGGRSAVKIIKLSV